MPEIQIPTIVITGLQVILAFAGAFLVALWVSLIVWTFRDARARSRDIFAILLATLMVAIFGPLGVLLYFLLRPKTTLAELYERSLEEEALLQDLEDRPRCPTCSRQVKEEWVLCPDCHTTLKNICLTCQNPLDLTWAICPYCGTHQTTDTPDSHQHPDWPGQQTVIQEPKPDTRPMSPTAPPTPVPEQPAPSPPASMPEQSSTSPRTDETRPQLPEAGPA